MSNNSDILTEHASQHWWFRGRLRIILSILRRYLPLHPGALLDVGCGTAELLRAVGRLRAMVTEGVDLELYGSTIDDAGLSAYGAILCCDVLEHVDDDAELLRKIANRLDVGGLLLVTVPAGPGLWSAHDYFHDHKRRYTARGLRSVLTGAGFRIVRLSYFQTLLFLPAAIGKLTRTHDGSDIRPVPAPLNALLAWLFGLERFLLRFLDLPFGTSLVAVAAKAAQ